MAKDKVNKFDIPMSEDITKKTDATKKECIEYLREMAAAEPEKIITRNHFRNFSPLAESAWSQHFGTFKEFKAQAGITPSRHAQAIEKNVAKHASVDILRKMTEEKRGFEGKYGRPSDKRFQTILVGSDIHDIECCPFWRKMFLETAKRVKPERVVLNGDIFDLPEFGKYDVDPREWDVVGRIQWVHTFLKELRQAVGDQPIDFIEGNHESRMLRHLAEATPAMKAILSDLHGFTVPKLLGLDKYQVNYVAPADLAVFTKADHNAEIRRNFLIINDFLVAHHFPEGSKFGMPGWNGHHHTHEVRSHFTPTMGTYEWHQLGSGHKREASYCNGERWGNGFLLVHTDIVAKRCQMEYIDTSNDFCIIGGKWYQR